MQIYFTYHPSIVELTPTPDLFHHNAARMLEAFLSGEGTEIQEIGDKPLSDPEGNRA